MAEAIVTIAAEGILKKVLSLAAGEVVLAWGYEEKLTGLHETLDLIRAKLGDAERQNGTKAVMVWLKQLKHVVNEADDVLDEIHYEMLRREVKKRDRMTRKVPSLPSLKKLSFRREMGHKIENINRKLVEINKKANDLGLQNEQPAGLVPDLNRETDPYLNEEFKIFGREDDELRIIQLLTQTRKEETLTIVPIVGMGGIGKTTLAKSIYNNPKIDQHFDVKAWLCVSVKVDVKTLLAKIYESLAREEPKSQTRVNLITDLQDKLGSKRYLLVLDDVWDEEKAHWDDFRSCMLKVHSKSGSGILVTTRSHKIGTKVMSEGFPALKGLSDDWCWCIFKKRAFLAGQSPSPELEEIGRDIVIKCRGFPLLVNVMGGMLRNCDKEKWLSIRDSKVWDLTEEGDRVQNSLKLSFDNLPNSIVKQCFAYCSIFKKDKVMKRENLVRLWMALGLVQADERTNKEAEDVGNGIFQILVSSSLFQDVKVDKYGYVTCCMHDLVHDLSISLSKHESLCLVDPTSDDIARITQVKHLAISYPKYYLDNMSISFEEMISVVFKEDMTTRTLQTLIFQGKIEKNISFQRFKSVRILKFNGCRLKKIDDSIGELVHLRYLDLSNNYDIDVLPESIGKLYHLQTLKLYGWLKKWPKNMHNLISLQHLTIKEHTITQRHEIAELGPLKHLAGKLSFACLEMISRKEDAAKANLSAKRNLYHIKFRWSSSEGANRNDKDVLEGLQPPQNVKSLIIVNFSGDDYPSWVTKMAIDIGGKWMPLHKLIDIELIECSCLYLPVLENLPVLQNLVLENMDNLTCLSNPLVKGEIVTGSMKPLSPSLRSLRLMYMRRLEKWIEAATSNSSTMLSPVLESLYIIDCPKITHLDESHPHPLVSLKIEKCENLVSIKSIQGLTSLESLEIRRCPSLLEIVTGSMKPLSPSLRSLCLERMERLEKWIDAATTNSSTMLSPVLESLDIYSCPKITHLDESHPHPLVSLEISYCENLVSIKSIQGLTSLESLEIKHCPSLLEIGFLQNYEHHPLKRLHVFNTQKLTSLPRFDCFSFLNTLELGPFSEELHSFPSLQGIEKSRNHLRSLLLQGRDHWESIPEEIKHLTSLTELTICRFGMRELPMWLTNMSCIRKMSFIKCSRLDKETVKRGAPRGADHVSLDFVSLDHVSLDLDSCI